MRSARGQAVLEFALVVPVLVLVMFGVLDAGRGVVAWISLTNAAADGVRFAASTWCNPQSTWAAATTAHVRAAAAGTTSSQISVTPTFDPFSQVVRLQLSYPFLPATPLLGPVLGPITLSVSSSTLAGWCHPS